MADPTVANGSTVGIRWYEVTGVTGTPSIRQQGTFAPADGMYRWMPSASVDKQGNMAAAEVERRKCERVGHVSTLRGRSLRPRCLLSGRPPAA